MCDGAHLRPQQSYAGGKAVIGKLSKALKGETAWGTQSAEAVTNQQGERQESTCLLIPIHGPRDARAHTLTHTQMKRSQVLWKKNPAHSIVCLVVETLVSNQENLKQ